MSDAASYHEEEALGKVYDARLGRRLLHYARPYRRAILAAVILTILFAATESVVPIFFKVAIDQYLAPTPEPDAKLLFATRHLPADPGAGLEVLTVLFLAAMAATFVLEYTRARLTLLTGQRVMFDLRREIFGHLQRLPVAFFDKNPVGRLVTRTTTDVDSLNEAFSAGIVAIFGDLLMLLGYVVILFYFDWRLALICMSVLPLIGLVTALFRRLAREAFRRTRIAIARINAFLNEHLSGMTVVQLFNRERHAARQFDQINRQNLEAWRSAILAHSWFYPAIEVISLLALAAIIWRGGIHVNQNFATTGTVVMFLLY
ncbi:MAG: ABC transporter ATP-binding protein, partial [Terriglobia bacterium]